MPDFRTIVTAKKLNFPIGTDSVIYLSGSCFAENIADKMKSFRMPNLCNPFGVIYNPVSIARTIDYHIAQSEFTTNDLIVADDKYCHPDFHSRVAGVTADDALKQMHKAVNLGHDWLKRTSHVIITLGTSLVYQLKATTKIVANNHKLSAVLFDKVQLSVTEVKVQLEQLLAELTQFNPNLIVIFTISPVRHWRDGAIENCRSKAVLIEAIQLALTNSNAYYFPAYEIMMDDLRDYRFYADDMLHPNAVAIDYIWEQFLQACTTEKLQLSIQHQKEINAAMQHRPFYPDSAKHQVFREKMVVKIDQFKKEFPEVDMQDATDFFSNY